MGRTAKRDSHERSVADLRQSGPVGAELAPTLERLLGKKSKSEYSSTSITRADAEEAVKRAERLVDAAKRLITSGS